MLRDEWIALTFGISALHAHVIGVSMLALEVKDFLARASSVGLTEHFRAGINTRFAQRIKCSSPSKLLSHDESSARANKVLHQGVVSCVSTISIAPHESFNGASSSCYSASSIMLRSALLTASLWILALEID